MKLNLPKREKHHKRSYAEKPLSSIHEYIKKGKKRNKSIHNTLENRGHGPKKPRGTQAKQEKQS